MRAQLERRLFYRKPSARARGVCEGLFVRGLVNRPVWRGVDIAAIAHRLYRARLPKRICQLLAYTTYMYVYAAFAGSVGALQAVAA